MSDPIHELRELAHQGVDVTPLPPSEVRRRGERLRRRHNALAAVGGVAAIALIATPIAILAGGDNQALQPTNPSSPTVTTTQSATPGVWLTTIPAGFPLAQGWPEPTEPGEGLGIAGPSRNLAVDEPGAMCPATAVSVPAPVDELAATWTQPADYRSRQLLLFASNGQAQQYADWLRDTFANCEGVESGDGYVISASVVDYQPVTFAWNATLRSELQGAPAPGLQLVQVAVVGNAVLVNAGSDEGSSAQAMNNEYAGQVVGVLAAMDVFTGEPQSSDSPHTTAPDVSDIPEDFPLDVDTEADGGEFEKVGPSPTAEGVVFPDLCRPDGWPVTGNDRLAVNVSGPEYGDDRTLLVLDNADQAVAALQGIRAVVSNCPADVNVVYDILQRDTGYDSFTFGSSYTDGLGSDVWQATRVGRGLLLLHTYGEGSRDSLPLQADAVTELTAKITPAMCAFTEAGC